MLKRKKMSKNKSRRDFTKKAVKTHKFNLQSQTSMPMRGGIRM